MLNGEPMELSASSRLQHGGGGVGAPLAAALVRYRQALIVLVLLLSVGAFAVSGALLLRAIRENSTIRLLAGGTDLPVSLQHNSSKAIAARAYFLLHHDRKDEAQALLDAGAREIGAPERALMLFNHANAHVRDAIASIEKGKLDAAIPLVMLAKEQYRQSLRIERGAWDAKYNYDVALRLVRDFPGYESEDDEDPPDSAKRLWTDLPGVPQGAP